MGSHLVYVEKLPEDCIKIESYLGHTFENLYYSPSEDAFFQSPKVKYRKLEVGKTAFFCRADENKTIRVSVKKIKEQIKPQ